MAETAGFACVTITTKPEYIAAFENAQDPLYARIASQLPAGLRISDIITSADITAEQKVPGTLSV